MRSIPFILALLWVGLQSNAQSAKVDSGQVLIFQNARIDRLVQQHIEVNKETTTAQGWRLQILSTSDEKKAQKMKMQFRDQAYKEEIYLDYKQPYYKLRIGDYRTKLEAHKARQDFLPIYKDAFIVPDEIVIKKN